jgi:hypothetical protein
VAGYVLKWEDVIELSDKHPHPAKRLLDQDNFNNDSDKENSKDNTKKVIDLKGSGILVEFEMRF